MWRRPWGAALRRCPPRRRSTSSVTRLWSRLPRQWASSTPTRPPPPPGFSGRNRTPRRWRNRQRSVRCLMMTSTRRPLPSRPTSRTRTPPPGRPLRHRSHRRRLVGRLHSRRRHPRRGDAGAQVGKPAYFVPRRAAQEAAGQEGAGAAPTGATARRGGQRRHQKTQRLSRRPAPTLSGGLRPITCAARRSFARSRWLEAWPGCGCCRTGPPTPRPSRAVLRERWRSSAGLPTRLPWRRPSRAGGYADARCSTSAGHVGGRARGDHPGAWFRNFADIAAYALGFPASVVYGICSAGIFFDFYSGYQFDDGPFRWTALAGRGTALGTRASGAGRSRPTPGTPSASHCTSLAPIFRHRGAPHRPRMGRRTPGRTRSAWRPRLRRGQTSPSRLESSSGPCRLRHAAAGSLAILRLAPPRGSAGALWRCPGSYRPGRERCAPTAPGASAR